MTLYRRVILAAVFLAPVAPVSAQTAAPLLETRPAFVPGYYETESRNSHFPKTPAKGKVCLDAADVDTFRRETIDQYRNSPQFLKVCALSDSKLLPDGFAFAMDCKQTKVVSIFHFSKDMVLDEMATIVPSAPSASSKILTIMHRIGDCPGKPTGKDM